MSDPVPAGPVAAEGVGVEPTRPQGLSAEAAAARLGQVGPNSLPEPPAVPLVRRVLRSMRDPLVLVLLAAFLLTLLTGDITDGAVIAIVVAVNTTLAVRQEVRADQAVRALNRLVATSARVIRSGRHLEVPVADLVPGDLVVLRQGDLVPADVLLLDGVGVQVDESSLTGESFPVDKHPGEDPGSEPTTGPFSPRDADAQALYSGTVVVHGRGLARVTTTGPPSALGQIAAMVGEVSPTTPLQRRMTRLSGQLAIAAITLSAVVMAVGLLQGQSFELMLLTAIALIVAAVPESLPLVVTVSLALAARRMATRHAVVRNLAAVETLGSVTLLATDKTGTLTRAEMTVSEVWQSPGADEDALMQALVVCSDAVVEPSTGRIHGDPTETALLRAAAANDVDVRSMRAAYPRLSEVPFDSTTKRMLTLHRTPSGRYRTVCKGAPEALLRPQVLLDGEEVLARARSQAEALALRGIRVIAVAARDDAEPPQGSAEPRPHGLHLLGLLGLKDPLRASSRQTVLTCREAGMRVVLVTGDHPATAGAIAGEAGIVDEEATSIHAAESTEDLSRTTRVGVVARATPADKLELVSAWQRAGQVVAMTGDGVNDAPALRRADIGVAMGTRGTEVARQSADLVLADDNLDTVVAAVEEGRRVYANIRRFLLYGLSGGAAEVVLMLLGPVVGIPLPLLPAQILWVNLLTHSFAGAGLATQAVDPGAMTRPPRPPRQGVFAEGLWWRTGLIALYLAVASLGVALVVGSGDATAAGRSASLLALGAGQLAVAWGVRTRGAPVWRRGRVVDPLVPALAAAGLLLIASVLVPPLRDLLGTTVVGAEVWGPVALATLGAYILAKLAGPRRF